MNQHIWAFYVLFVTVLSDCSHPPEDGPFAGEISISPGWNA